MKGLPMCDHYCLNIFERFPVAGIARHATGVPIHLTGPLPGMVSRTMVLFALLKFFFLLSLSTPP